MMAEKTKICCLDVDEEILAYLKKDHDVYPGSLGKKVSLPEKSKRLLRMLPNYNFPPNIQEYDVFVIDMREGEMVEYFPEEYLPTYNETGEDSQIICNSNANVFNPIPYGAITLLKSLYAKNDKRPIIIVFQNECVKRQYRWGDREGYLKGEEEHTNYDFARVPMFRNLYGTQVKVADNDAAEVMFKDWLNGIQTYCVFDCLGRDKYTPLLLNNNGQCVSYIESSKEEILFMLPQMKNKAQFIEHLFNDIIYESLSEYFPYVESKRWIHKPEYQLPNEEGMVKELEQLEKEYNEKKAAIAQRMADNVKEYDFLHTMLTGTGGELVSATIKYLEWLGFENVIDKDTTVANDDLEEDIQIDLGEDGLLVIEVKGINGTSRDILCAQIEKIKHRRERERHAFDVCALYIVNHQRNVEPYKRQNPPFLPKQVTDAEDDQRGLATTWQLYNLFADIEKGIISKADARKALLQYGLVKFVPSDAKIIGVPYRYLSNNVICIELDGQEVSVGDELFAFDGYHWQHAKVETIELNKNRLETIDKGRVGMGLNAPLPEETEIYVRHRKGDRE